MKRCIFLSIVALLTVSCAYNREDGCHLDKFNVNGNVKKIETIVRSTIPLTELYYGSFDPSQAISMLAGNFEFDFDNHGNLQKMTGYGIDGKVLFETYDIGRHQKSYTAPSVIGVSARMTIDRVETVSTPDRKVVNAKYYSGDELIWNQKATYNDKGYIASITKEYASLGIDTDLLNIKTEDITTYEYSSLDEHGNWTVAKVHYKGLLPKHEYEYKVVRRITYDGDSGTTPLIEQLKSVNECKVPVGNSDFYDVNLGSYGSMKIPYYMELQSNNCYSSVSDIMQIPAGTEYLLSSVYSGRDAYATISVARNYVGEDDGFEELSEAGLSYSQELDDMLREQNTELMAQGGTYVLKWLPYQFVDISGKRSMKLSYYRYGNGSPIPVYCENYIMPMKDGYILSIIYSFQSNQDNKFRNDFSYAINSIRFR